LSDISGGGPSSCSPSFINVDTGSLFEWDTCNYSTLQYTLTSNVTIQMIDPQDGQSYAAILKQDATGGRSILYTAELRTIVEVNDYDQSPNAITIASYTVTPTHVYILYTPLSIVELTDNIRHSVIKSSTTIDETLINASPSTRILKGTNQYYVNPPEIASADLTGNETENVVYFIAEPIDEPLKTSFTWLRNSGSTYFSGTVASYFTVTTTTNYRIYKSSNILAGLFDGLTLGQVNLFTPNQVNITF
jgi:hypothetical protein